MGKYKYWIYGIISLIVWFLICSEEVSFFIFKHIGFVGIFIEVFFIKYDGWLVAVAFFFKAVEENRNGR